MYLKVSNIIAAELAIFDRAHVLAGILPLPIRRTARRSRNAGIEGGIQVNFRASV